MAISKNANKTITELKSKLRVDKSFDIIYRPITVCSRNAAMFFVDGFTKDEVMEKIMEYFYSIDSSTDIDKADIFIKKCVPYVEVSSSGDIDSVCISVLSGMLAVVIDDLDKIILLDVRTYPQRETDEPEKDKVLRGSRDGFVETLISNTALIRRRIRNTNLSMKHLTVGSISQTDVVLCYMDDRVDKKLLNSITQRISSLKVDSLTMNQQSLAEALFKHKWYNPFPKVKHSERPDTAASSVLEGNIVILVDNSPSVTIIPTSIFDILEEADDYYFPPITGTYLRLSRYIITFFTLIITPLWLLLMQNPQLIPENLSFIIAKDPNVPIIIQLIILEFAIDGLRLAAMNTPSTLTTPLSIIGAIILSDFAVSSGWFSTETMLYMAFVAMSNYSQPSFELGYALKFMRIIMLIMTSLFNMVGFVLSLILVLVLIGSNQTLSGKSYLYPLIPFNHKEFMRKIIRSRIKRTQKQEN